MSEAVENIVSLLQRPRAQLNKKDLCKEVLLGTFKFTILLTIARFIWQHCHGENHDACKLEKTRQLVKQIMFSDPTDLAAKNINSWRDLHLVLERIAICRSGSVLPFSIGANFEATDMSVNDLYMYASNLNKVAVEEANGVPITTIDLQLDNWFGFVVTSQFHLTSSFLLQPEAKDDESSKPPIVGGTREKTYMFSLAELDLNENFLKVEMIQQWRWTFARDMSFCIGESCPEIKTQKDINDAACMVLICSNFDSRVCRGKHGLMNAIEVIMIHRALQEADKRNDPSMKKILRSRRSHGDYSKARIVKQLLSHVSIANLYWYAQLLNGFTDDDIVTYAEVLKSWFSPCCILEQLEQKQLQTVDFKDVDWSLLSL